MHKQNATNTQYIDTHHSPDAIRERAEHVLHPVGLGRQGIHAAHQRLQQVRVVVQKGRVAGLGALLGQVALLLEGGVRGEVVEVGEGDAHVSCLLVPYKDTQQKLK